MKLCNFAQQSDPICRECLLFSLLQHYGADFFLSKIDEKREFVLFKCLLVFFWVFMWRSFLQLTIKHIFSPSFSAVGIFSAYRTIFSEISIQVFFIGCCSASSSKSEYFPFNCDKSMALMELMYSQMSRCGRYFGFALLLHFS